MAIKKRFVPQLHNLSTKDQNLKAIIDGFSNIDFGGMLDDITNNQVKEGVVVKGQVIEVNKEVVIVDVGLKNEGRIPVSEFLACEDHGVPSEGDVVEVYVEKIESRKGTILSREKAIREKSWTKLSEYLDKNQPVNGVITSRVKGGFAVDLKGVIAFLPGSQVDVRPIKDISTLLDIEQPFQILKMDRDLGNIVVSRRAILEESRSEAREEMLGQIKEGMILDGVIKNITDYGAFVDLKHVDGLLHVTDISWSRINHPSEILTIGQEVKVMVIKYNEETKRISLGMKQLDKNPWDSIKDEFPEGKVLTGKITNIADYGVFIELKDGIEGLVHSSEISWGKNTPNPKKILSIGQEVEFMILDVNTEKHRISLSIKRCVSNPLVEFSKQHPVGSVVKLPIRNITDFGLFVAINENIDGMIHESDISWEDKGLELLKDFQKGDEVECQVLNIDVDKERVALGIKQLSENPNAGNDGEVFDFNKNDYVTCVVTDVRADGIEVLVQDKAMGFIKKTELSSEKSDQKPERFAENDKVDAKVIAVDKGAKRLMLSIKELEIEDRAKAIKEYGSTDSGASLGDILGAALGAHDSSKAFEAKENADDKKSSADKS